MGCARGADAVRRLLGVVAGNALDFVFRAQNHRNALMQAGRRDIHNALAAGAGGATGLFHQEGHRVGFIHQAQLAALGLVFGRLS